MIRRIPFSLYLQINFATILFDLYLHNFHVISQSHENPPNVPCNIYNNSPHAIHSYTHTWTQINNIQL